MLMTSRAKLSRSRMYDIILDTIQYYKTSDGRPTSRREEMLRRSPTCCRIQLSPLRYVDGARIAAEYDPAVFCNPRTKRLCSSWPGTVRPCTST